MAEKLDIVALVEEEFSNALGAPGGEIASERAEAFEYYLSEPFGDEEEGSSQVVTSDVADVVDGMMPSMLRLFTTAENLVSFDAVGPEDRIQAEQESDYVNYVFFKQNPAFEILFFWMFDAFVQKNGYVKAWWDESEEITNESYKGLTENELNGLMEDDELKPVEQEEREEEVVLNGQTIKMTVHDVKFKRVRKVGQVVIANVPPEEFRISADSRSLDPSKARMVGHEREVTRDELIAMGFKKKVVDDLPAEQKPLGTEEIARKNKSDERKDTAKNRDKSQDKILLREAYIDVDTNNDGRSELKQVFIANGEELETSDADRQPFHCICPHPLAHKHFGKATAEKVKDIQRIGSKLLREILNNLYHTNKPGHAVWEQGIGENTMDDLLTTRIGRVARFKRPVQESYTPMTVPFTAAESFPMVQYFDKLKRDRTGISSDSEGLSPEALKNIQTTVMAQSTDLSKMKIEAIARIFAETGFKSLFRHIHELVQKHQNKPDIVELRGSFVPVDPSEWRHRRNMTVNIGLGIGTRETNLLHLNAIWDKQSQMVSGGGMNLTVTPKNIYNTAAELVKNANLKLPSMFFTDPGDKKAPPPASEVDELKKREMAIQERQQKLDGERNQINAQKAELATQEQALVHQREIKKLEEKTEEREDKFANENEKLRNDIVELQDKIRSSQQKDRTETVKAAADITKTAAETEKIRAETRDLEEETQGKGLERDAAETGLTKLAEDLGSEETE